MVPLPWIYPLMEKSIFPTPNASIDEITSEKDHWKQGRELYILKDQVGSCRIVKLHTTSKGEKKSLIAFCAVTMLSRQGNNWTLGSWPHWLSATTANQAHAVPSCPLLNARSQLYHLQILFRTLPHLINSGRQAQQKGAPKHWPPAISI